MHGCYIKKLNMASLFEHKVILELLKIPNVLVMVSFLVMQQIKTSLINLLYGFPSPF